MEKNGIPESRSVSIGISRLLHRFTCCIPFPDGPWSEPLKPSHCRRPADDSTDPHEPDQREAWGAVAPMTKGCIDDEKPK
jgi:hypothetical protein